MSGLTTLQLQAEGKAGNEGKGKAAVTACGAPAVTAGHFNYGLGYCCLTAIVVDSGRPATEPSVLAMLRSTTATGTVALGATLSGIFTLICQTPTSPGARPEKSTLASGTRCVPINDLRQLGSHQKRTAGNGRAVGGRIRDHSLTGSEQLHHPAAAFGICGIVLGAILVERRDLSRAARALGEQCRAGRSQSSPCWQR